MGLLYNKIELHREIPELYRKAMELLYDEVELHREIPELSHKAMGLLYEKTGLPRKEPCFPSPACPGTPIRRVSPSRRNRPRTLDPKKLLCLEIRKTNASKDPNLGLSPQQPVYFWVLTRNNFSSGVLLKAHPLD